MSHFDVKLWSIPADKLFGIRVALIVDAKAVGSAIILNTGYLKRLEVLMCHRGNGYAHTIMQKICGRSSPILPRTLEAMPDEPTVAALRRNPHIQPDVEALVKFYRQYGFRKARCPVELYKVGGTWMERRREGR